MHPNPLGLEGFSFIEFAAPDPAPLGDLFRRLGFTLTARHARRAVELYRQGDIIFLLNSEPQTFAAAFAAEHGPCCAGFGLRVADAEAAYRQLLADGVASLGQAPGPAVDCPRVRGIGGSMLYLTDGRLSDLTQHGFEVVAGAPPAPAGFGLTFIDHLTHNVYDGNMDHWAEFYARHFGFYEVKYFDIRGAVTGLRSRAMTAPHGRISIPVNESSDPKSQINEYLDQYRGEGVQHIALYTDDIYPTVEAMRERGIEFLDTPDTYYEAVDERIPGHGEDLARMQANKILIDADNMDRSKQLLQIFTQTVIGPIFFEIIQRKGNKGFGEGNFTALFEAIERDQQKRGVL